MWEEWFKEGEEIVAFLSAANARRRRPTSGERTSGETLAAVRPWHGAHRRWNGCSGHSVVAGCGRHFGERADRNGEMRFRSFACSCGVDGRSFNLYLQTRPHGRWVVLADR